MADAEPPRGASRSRGRQRPTVRILTAVPICDGHDSAITTINLELARHGAEVVYLGYHCPASSIARAAVQEDVQAVGISSYNGGHVVFFREVREQLRARGAGRLPILGGGGGTMTSADAAALRRSGIGPIFFAGTPLDRMTRTVVETARGYHPNARAAGDAGLARAITEAERAGPSHRRRRTPRPAGSALVVGVAGPGGAGKSTLIDELTSRFLAEGSIRRIAILANDPSHPESGGAILGDRVSAIYSQDERVFFRSLATRGHPSGLSAAAPAAVEILRNSGQFDVIFVESIGIGQESDPFGVFRGPRLADLVILVLSPHYGGRIQLQKIALLEGADLVALNKCDQPAAHAARAELSERIARSARPLFATVAARHGDAGTDALRAEIERRRA